MSTYCTKCGDTGVLIDGSLCDCGKSIKDADRSMECLTIPTQYRNLRFDKNLVQDVTGSGVYPNFLQKLYDDITSLKFGSQNMFLASPVKCSKTVLAYSCIQNLFRRGVQTFPLFDILELKIIMADTDNGKVCPLLEDMDAIPMNIYKSPILFVKIPNQLDYNVFDTMVLLMNRRTRRNNSTIFIYDGSWSYFAKADVHNKVSMYLGDGSYGTIVNRTFYPKEVKTDE